MMSINEKITAILRVVGSTIKRWDYANNQPYSESQHLLPSVLGEAMEVRAVGEWECLDADEVTKLKFPMSLHVTVYPGCGAIPVTGNHIKVSFEQAQYEDGQPKL